MNERKYSPDTCSMNSIVVKIIMRILVKKLRKENDIARKHISTIT
jgi:hypothetical protein